MARLNARQKRAHKRRVEHNKLAQSCNAPIVTFTGDLRSSQAQFDGSNHKPPHGTYNVPAVRPTIVTGKKKSGKVETVNAAEGIKPSTVDHSSRHDLATRPAALIVRKGSPKLRLVAPKPVQELTFDQRFERAKRLHLSVQKPRRPKGCH